MDEQQVLEPTRRVPWSLKLLAAAAFGMLVGIGFCGLDAHFYPGAEFGGSSLAGIGALLIVASGLALVVAVIGLAVFGLRRL